ncbi:MAG: AMP-binding protein [Clostridia bacterium]|nr:AMP-binding protein [Clostridia bacterium]
MEEIKYVESLKDIINVRCDMFKDKVAFLEKEDGSKEFRKIKYSQVKEDVNALGTIMLKKLNLKDKKIAVIGENSYRWYATYMAVACGVGIIVPLDKELPSNEIQNLMERSEASCIVYSSRKKDLIEEIRGNLPKDIIYIEMSKKNSDDFSYSYDELVEEGKELVDTGVTEYIDTKIDRDEFKILLFTSGTTAASKGVMLCHKNICTDIAACYHLVPEMGEFTYLSVLPIHHTYEFSLVYIYGTFIGATIGICEGLKYVAKNMKEIRPNVLFAVPALIEKLSAKIDKAIADTGKEKVIRTAGKVAIGLSKIGLDFRRKLFKSVQENFGGKLTHIFCGAAPIDKDIIEKLESYGFKFFQGFGVTEASPLIAGTPKDGRVAGTCGKAVYGTEVRIDLSKNEDENSNIGEIIAKGDNIMIGYYNDEEKTAEALKGGWFYTGDLGYFDIKGNLVITGRTKNVIVTSNGKNIYPEELETLINRIPLVNESMVYGAKDPKNKQELIVTAKVTLDEEYIEATYGSTKPSDDAIYKEIWEEIKKINRSLVSYKAIKKLEVKKDDFIKTTTMKIKRFAELEKDNKK